MADENPFFDIEETPLAPAREAMKIAFRFPELRDRDMMTPLRLAVGDGAMGFPAALCEIYPKSRQ